MLIKNCKNCGKSFQLDESKAQENVYLRTGFNRKVYCSSECRNEFNHKIYANKNPYLTQFDEHNKLVFKINSFINGEIVRFKGVEGYYPDIIKDDKDYEIEVFRKLYHLNQKIKKWNIARKHILIVSISKKSIEIFDEVFFFDGEKLTKL